MKKIKLVERDGVFVPEEPYPADTIAVRGDIEPGYYICYQPGDEVQAPVEDA